MHTQPFDAAAGARRPVGEDGPGCLDRDRLHAGIVDPEMDSMRILSETAMKFPAALSFSSGAPHDGNHDLSKLSYYTDRYLKHLEDQGCRGSGSPA